MVRCALITGLCLYIAAAAGQGLVYDRKILSIEDGLTLRHIFEITEDHRGFIWLAGRDGLIRFDGEELTRFSDASGSLPLKGKTIINCRQADSVWLTLDYDHRFFPGIEVIDMRSGELHYLQSDAEHGVPGMLLTKSFDAQGHSIALSYHDDSLVVSRLDYTAWRYVSEIRFPAPAAFHAYTIDQKANFSLFVSKGYYWVRLYDEHGYSILARIDAASGANRSYSFSHHSYFIESTLFELGDGTILYSAEDGRVYRYRSDTGEFVLSFPELPPGVYRFAEDTLGNILIFSPRNRTLLGNSNKLWLWAKDGTLIDYSAIIEGVEHLYTLYSRDLTSLIHLGTDRGYERVFLRGGKIMRHAATAGHTSYGVSGRSMIRMDSVHILMTTDYQGNYILNTRTGRLHRPGEIFGFASILASGMQSRNLVKDAQGAIWGKFDSRDVFRFDIAAATVDTFYFGDNEGSLSLGGDGRLYAIGHDSLGMYDIKARRATWLKDAGGGNLLSGMQATFGQVFGDTTLWVASSDGLMRYDLRTGQTQQFRLTPEDAGATEWISCFITDKDDDHIFWAGTLGKGLLKFDTRTGKFLRQYTTADGLCSHDIAALIYDSAGRLWVSTYNGLSHFIPASGTFDNFFTIDGFSHNEFNRFSAYYDDQDDLMYMGTMNGFNAFHPDELLARERRPVRLRLKRLQWQDAAERSDRHVLFFPSNTFDITLPPNNRNTQIHFGIIDYEDARYNRYAYRLKGLDDTWIDLGNSTMLRLDFLPAGRYICEIRGISKQGHKAEDPLILHVRVLQFWYWQWWAILGYAAILGGAIWLIYRFTLRRKLALQETQKLAELNRFKDDFFTNVTHEFKTPLTIILGSAEELLASAKTPVGPVKETTAQHAGRISSSGKNLLRLINQILDLTKKQEGKWDPEYIQGDIVLFLMDVALGFEALAHTQGVTLSVESEAEELIMDYDPRQLRLIMHNLLSNAIKFTPQSGRVALKIDAQQGRKEVHITVEDTGIGIAEKDIDRIFEKYYMVSNAQNQYGTGIGLALVKELVDKMDGRISVRSEPGKGSAFTLAMPMRNVAQLITSTFHEEEPDRSFFDADIVPLQEQTVELLIMEDNPDICAFLKSCLQDQYIIRFAHNGKTGVGMAIEHSPDIILSDIMMPVMDGLEACAILKEDIRTDHIPIVFLTAKSEIQHRIEGIRKGADAYLAKPFNVTELKATLSNLILQRQKLQAHYSSFVREDIEQEPEMSVAHDPNEQLLLRLKQFIFSRLEDPDLSADDLCKAATMSYSHLNRKLVALSGYSPSEMIRMIRLQKARELLAGSDLNVSEVAYRVGFNDPKYFSRLFIREFGERPGDKRSMGV